MLENYIRAICLLFKSLIGSDIPILLCAFVTFGVFMKTRGLRESLINHSALEEVSDKEAIRKNALDTSRCYYFFLTLISVFPLLGMLGTVLGLLGLNLATGDMENIKINFFMALTSTGWGIIFSIFFKIIGSLYLEDVDSLVESAKRISEADQ